MGRRTVVTDAFSVTPLRLLAPKNHGHAAWVFQSSHGGGLVGADHIALRVDVAAGATLFLSSQATNRAYGHTHAKTELDVAIGDGATCIAWPDPLVCFAGARLEQALRFRLQPTASLIVVDAHGAGRVARGERWAFERLCLRLAIDIGEIRVLDDAMLLSPRAGALADRLARVDAFATVVLAGPNVDPLARALAADIAAAPAARASVLLSASAWPWGVIIRAAAPSMAELTAQLTALLRVRVHELLGDDPWKRKF